MNTEADLSHVVLIRWGLWALVARCWRVAAVIIAYWLVLPAVVLGLIAVILGVVVRLEHGRRAGIAAADITGYGRPDSSFSTSTHRRARTACTTGPSCDE
ncbi:MAG TPA: hypothetical protein VGR26_16775 [Acidimicrobiales bacterium]|nr:hypothetical protein [Acidimicrobiales bacterium]